MPTHHHEHPDVDCEVLADAMGPTPEAPGAQPPPPPVRAARLLAAGDRVMTRLDTLLERTLPRDLNPLAHLGAAANAMVLLATLSGVLMLFWYSPSVVLAWHSLADLAPHSLGGLVRSVHRYSSDLLMLLVLTHALRMLLARKFAGARWLAWASGIMLVGLVWFIGWTGYWLVWDERAQLLALDTIRTLDVLPIFGEPMLRLFAADRTVPSLLFFVVFFLHMALPLGIAGGLCLHLARLSRSRLLPDWRLSLWLSGAVLAARSSLSRAQRPGGGDGGEARAVHDGLVVSLAAHGHRALLGRRHLAGGGAHGGGPADRAVVAGAPATAPAVPGHGQHLPLLLLHPLHAGLPLWRHHDGAAHRREAVPLAGAD
jgi:hypothetical protein